MTLAGKPRFDAESYTRYTDRILRVLADGPLTAAVVAERMGEPHLHRVSWFLGAMTRTGHAHIYALSARREGCRYRQRPLYAAGPRPDDLPSLPPPPPEPWIKPKKAAGEIIGVDAGDLAWMAYWRERWERRRRAAKPATLDRAA